jgi:hypothetical protein
MAVTVEGDAHGMRRGSDALPRAAIGTVPIPWYHAPDADRWDAPTLLDEVARLGYEGIQLGRDFPDGPVLGDELGRRRLRLAEVYVALPATPDGPTPEAMAVATACLTEQDASAGPPSEAAAIGRRVLAASLRRLGGPGATRRIRSVA